MESHKAFIARHKKLYHEIRFIVCPALGGEKVYFNKHGFSHLIRKGKNPRPNVEQRRRLKLLRYCSAALRNPKVEIEYRSTINENSIAYFWNFKAVVSNIKIEIVVRQINSGSKHFFSIF